MLETKLKWFSTKDIPKDESNIIALYYNASFHSIFLWGIPWEKLIQGNKKLGKMLCWSYLPHNNYLKMIMLHFNRL